ncbi:hypothetical protein [Actinomadura rugatobispora]|uniref:Uncharacterized protein n=1 Tax=Actinomadura rugatobispora TaxID=1994 RepID=A0ABW0ZYM8_9ACTN|nr:hypothetical protein GCM10010200_098140 [Actinomadura rugatobispora]
MGERESEARLQDAFDPKRRGQYLTDLFQERVVGRPGREVRLFGGGADRVMVLRATYSAVLRHDSRLMPGADAVAAVVEAVTASRAEAAATHRVMAPLDYGARRYLTLGSTVWQARMAPHSPPDPALDPAVDGARQTLDAVLTGAIDGPTVGDLVELADRETAVVTEAVWLPDARIGRSPVAYLVGPVIGGPPRGIAVFAWDLTAVPAGDTAGPRSDREPRPAYTAAVTLAGLLAERKARKAAP